MQEGIVSPIFHIEIRMKICAILRKPHMICAYNKTECSLGNAKADNNFETLQAEETTKKHRGVAIKNRLVFVRFLSLPLGAPTAAQLQKEAHGAMSRGSDLTATASSRQAGHRCRGPLTLPLQHWRHPGCDVMKYHPWLLASH